MGGVEVGATVDDDSVLEVDDSEVVVMDKLLAVLLVVGVEVLEDGNLLLDLEVSLVEEVATLDDEDDAVLVDKVDKEVPLDEKLVLLDVPGKVVLLTEVDERVLSDLEVELPDELPELEESLEVLLEVVAIPLELP